MKAGRKKEEKKCALKFHVSAKNIYYVTVSAKHKLYWDWALKKLRDKGISVILNKGLTCWVKHDVEYMK